MVTDLTSRLAMPLLQVGQAQKEVTHNEALTRLDGLIHLAVESRNLAAPPASPQAGGRWIVAAAAAGAWAGQEDTLAEWDGTGWNFLTAPAGMIAWIVDEAILAVRAEDGWHADFLPVGGLSIDGNELFGVPRNDVMEPAGGSVIDVEARNCLGELLIYLRAQGVLGG